MNDSEDLKRWLKRKNQRLCWRRGNTVKHGPWVKRCNSKKKVSSSGRARTSKKRPRISFLSIATGRLIILEWNEGSRGNGEIYRGQATRVICIHGNQDMHATTRKHLFSLGLRRIFSAVFVKPTYVTYGYPNLKSIKEIIYKKGLAKIDNQIMPPTTKFQHIQLSISQIPNGT